MSPLGRRGRGGGSERELPDLEATPPPPPPPPPPRAAPRRRLLLFLLALLAAPALVLALAEAAAGAARLRAPLPPSAEAAAAAAAAALTQLVQRAEAVAAQASEDVAAAAEAAASWAPIRAAALAADAEAEAAAAAALAEAPQPAIAFLFLTRGELPHAALWAAFLRGAPSPAAWRLHVHAPPGHLYNASTVASPLFHGAQLAQPVEVQWGALSVVDAERRLFAAALADPAVQRFVLLSESCVPLRSFAFVQSYLLSSPSSFLDAFADVASQRYDPGLAEDGVPEAAWRKGTQWAALTRRHARAVVQDTAVYEAFRRRPSLFAPDEHYVQTLLAVLGQEGESERRPVTFANWHPPSRSHPKLYVVQEVTSELLVEMRGWREHFRPLEGVHSRCGGPREAPWLPPGAAREEGAGAPCWLFARKFTQRAGERLLEEHAALLGLVPPGNETADTVALREV